MTIKTFIKVSYFIIIIIIIIIINKKWLSVFISFLILTTH